MGAVPGGDAVDDREVRDGFAVQCRERQSEGVAGSGTDGGGDCGGGSEVSRGAE